MIPRYTRPEMGRIWSDESKFRAWLEVETTASEVLAAFGGFEMAMMVGVMLVASSKRHLVMVDGMPACAALMVAARIAPAVTDYCVYARSHSHQGLDQAFALFHASALLELGMESTDGTGATLAWPLVRSAAALLSEVAEGEDAGPTHPGTMGSGFDSSRGRLPISTPGTLGTGTHPGSLPPVSDDELPTTSSSAMPNSGHATTS